MHVLLTDDSYYPTLGIVRSLGKKGIRVSVLADTPKRLASYSRYCTARYVVPPPSEDSFIPAVVDILRRDHCDLIIPVGYASTAALARHREELGSLAKLEVADYEKIEASADKSYANALAANLGVPAPRTISPTNLDDVARLAQDLQYPVVIKRASEGASRIPVLYADNPAELLRLLGTFCGKEGHPGCSVLIQEFIPGFGCGFFALYQHGTCKRIFMHRRVRETPPRGGISCCAASYYDPKLKEYGTRLLDRLGWHGIAMVEFRYDSRHDDYKLMEINPKFWGSLDLALTAGVDFPFYLCQIAQGQTLDYSEEYNRTLRHHWPLLEMKHLWRRPASIGAVLADSVNPHVRSNISWPDIRPNLFEPFSRVRARLKWPLRLGRRQYDNYPVLEK